MPKVPPTFNLWARNWCYRRLEHGKTYQNLTINSSWPIKDAKLFTPLVDWPGAVDIPVLLLASSCPLFVNLFFCASTKKGGRGGYFTLSENISFAELDIATLLHCFWLTRAKKKSERFYLFLANTSSTNLDVFTVLWQTQNRQFSPFCSFWLTRNT